MGTGAALGIDVVTIFPEYLEPLRTALLGKAIEKGIIELGVHNLRRWTHDVHQSVDDAPYGGGPGMVMKPTVWGDALDEVCPDDALLVVPTPAGVPFTQATAERWSAERHLVFACGRYEGIDQRVFDDAARRVRVEEVSIGDYVLIGGEAAVLVMAEAVVRLIPGVLGNQLSHQQDSFSAGAEERDGPGLLEGPSYTRPVSWRGLDVPDILLSGNHARIESWRREQSLARTRQRRPDLLPPEQRVGEPDDRAVDLEEQVADPGTRPGESDRQVGE
ncbi:tRNA (guanosine(37)-N1)-methyltransferase TrmD [Nocardia sp. BMG51109]|uniref:tRNA (guanosine(37)-N1)-methyltransferase TrmD n=1 Tax=Nocardia sp. BMG51109 TaxID=1056816 RepID=UPI000465D658|nr:tRNA (guanosine(37)-N1)-methyltransferase TrmD [Nocardia sp. BMG51109]